MTINDMDFSLYVITDADVSGGRVHAEVVRLALEGGATAIQYRDKRAPVRRQLEVGRQLRDLAARHGAAFIVNDRPDLAMALGADGVHLGPEDLPADVVRAIVGPEMLISVSVDHPEDAREAEALGADYVMARPVFPTRWQVDSRPVMGRDGLAEIVRAVSIPVLADGGVNAETLEQVLAAGAAGPGVTSAVVGAKDPREAARQLRELLARHRTQAVGSTE